MHVGWLPNLMIRKIFCFSWFSVYSGYLKSFTFAINRKYENLLDALLFLVIGILVISPYRASILAEDISYASHVQHTLTMFLFEELRSSIIRNHHSAR